MGYIGTMERIMETTITIFGLGLRVWAVGEESASASCRALETIDC